MLPSEIVRRVREIQIRTGRHVADVLAGEYVSVFRGGGVEFDEVRPYVPGDDVRSIDWNVTARMGEPFVKRFVEERQLTIMIVADVSASQEFGSATKSKREAAAELCALLAFSAIQNDDNVGLVLFHGDIETYIPPRKGQKHALRVVREVLAHEPDETGAGGTRVGNIFGQLAAGVRNAISGWIGDGVDRRTAADANGNSRTGGSAAAASRTGTGASAERGLRRSPALRKLRSSREATDISRAIEFTLSVTRRRSVCFVVSDFQDENFLRAMQAANRKHDVIGVLISDPRETELPDVGLVSLTDAETGESRVIDTGSKAFREAVANQSSARIEQLRRSFGASGIDFIHVDAAAPVEEPLIRFFRMRERRMRR